MKNYREGTILIFILYILITGCTSNQMEEPSSIAPIVQANNSTDVSIPTNPSPTKTLAYYENNEKNLIVFVDIDGSVFTQDLHTGEIMSQENPMNIIDYIDWNMNGCDLLGLTPKGYVNVDIINNSYDWLYEFAEEVSTPNKFLVFPPIISPDGKKVAVVYGKGNFIEGMEYSVFEYQDLYIKMTDGSVSDIKLTLNGGEILVPWTRYLTLFTYWSPNSEWIVFSDLDGNGIYQIYVSQYDGENKYQLTSRTRKTNTPENFSYSIAWSPTSTKLAFTVFDDPNTYVIDLEKPSEKFILPDTGLFWWTDKEKLIVHSGDFSGFGLFDPATNQTIKLFSVEEYYYLVEPFGNRNNIGFFTFRQEESNTVSTFHVFNTNSMLMESYPNISLPSQVKIKTWFITQECN